MFFALTLKACMALGEQIGLAIWSWYGRQGCRFYNIGYTKYWNKRWSRRNGSLGWCLLRCAPLSVCVGLLKKLKICNAQCI